MLGLQLFNARVGTTTKYNPVSVLNHVIFLFQHTDTLADFKTSMHIYKMKASEILTPYDSNADARDIPTFPKY